MKKETFVELYLHINYDEQDQQFIAHDELFFGLRQSNNFKANTFKSLLSNVINKYDTLPKLNQIGWYASANTVDMQTFYHFAQSLDLELDEVEMVFDYKGKIKEKHSKYMDIDLHNEFQFRDSKDVTDLLKVIR